MKLNWECAREVLLAVEKLDNKDAVAPGTFADFDEEVVVEHIRLLTEAGLIESFPPHLPMFAKRLTWEGHLFLGNLRDRDLWHKIKLAAKTKSAELTFDAIKTLGKLLLEKKLGG